MVVPGLSADSTQVTDTFAGHCNCCVERHEAVETPGTIDSVSAFGRQTPSEDFAEADFGAAHESKKIDSSDSIEKDFGRLGHQSFLMGDKRPRDRGRSDVCGRCRSSAHSRPVVRSTRRRKRGRVIGKRSSEDGTGTCKDDGCWCFGVAGAPSAGRVNGEIGRADRAVGHDHGMPSTRRRRVLVDEYIGD